MQVINQHQADAEQALAFFTADDGEPVFMVNLLRFKDKATYADGSEPELSGRDAYLRYGAGVQACIAAVGGTAHYSGVVGGLLLGEVEDMWDMIAIVEYPSRAALIAMVQSPEYQAIEHHRDAGLAGQLNIATKPLAA